MQAGVGQQHQELLAAGAAQHIAFPAAAAHQFGQPTQYLVAHLMPVAIIDPLEVVDVQRHDAEITGLGLQQRQAELQVATVAQACERIGLGRAVEPSDTLLQQVEPEQQRPLELRGFKVPSLDLL